LATPLQFPFQSPVIVQNVAALLDRLKWLLHELEPWESRLEKARFDAKIRLKKEHDEILRAATTGNANHVTRSLLDPWEEELLSKVMSAKRLPYFCLVRRFVESWNLGAANKRMRR